MLASKAQIFPWLVGMIIFSMFIQVTDSSDDDINTNDVNCGVSSDSTNPNVNIVNTKIDHEEEDEVGRRIEKRRPVGHCKCNFKHSIAKS